MEAKRPKRSAARVASGPGELHDIIDAAWRKDSARIEEIGAWHYLRFTRGFRSVPVGTAVFGDTVVYGYPKIGRIFRLDQGLQAQFAHPFWVEEKIDGYNVRVFRQEDEVLALTRRGFVCPFTTDRMADLMDLTIFEARPDLVVCAEVVGPDNPYNESERAPADVPEDVRLFVFDLMRAGSPECLPYRRRGRLVEDFGLPAVPAYGRFRPDEAHRLSALMLELDRHVREGVVLKEDSSRDRRAKYVTGSINLADVRVSAKAVKQLPADYFIQRILRLALFMDEHGLRRTPELYRQLGEGLIEGIISAARQQRDHREVSDGFRCRFRHRANAELLMQTMQKLLGKGQVHQRRLEKEGEFYVLEFDKVLPKTTGLFAHLLRGGIIYD